jgi:hypothetical protein
MTSKQVALLDRAIESLTPEQVARFGVLAFASQLPKPLIVTSLIATAIKENGLAITNEDPTPDSFFDPALANQTMAEVPQPQLAAYAEDGEEDEVYHV